MIWGIIALILLLIIIGLVIWLLVRNSNCNSNKSGVNQACNTSADCSGGLVCSVINGITGMTGSVGGVNVGVVVSGGGRVCKVAYGGVCSANTDCASGQSCINGVCQVNAGTQGQACPCGVGFTCVNNVCRAIVGQPCTSNANCSTGICMNNICMASGTTGSTGHTGCWDSRDSHCRDSDSRYCRDSSSNSRHSRDDSESRHHSRDDSESRHHSRDDSESRHHSRDDSDSKRHSREHSRDSGDDSDHSKHYSHESDKFSSCSDSNCQRTAYSLDSSSSSSFDCSEKKCKKKKCDKSSSFDSNNSSNSSNSRYTRRGVYVTNQQNNDRTLFTAIEQPIIDVAKTDKIYLLLKNGNVAANAGINNTIYVTDKKMSRMVRFGNEIVGLGKKGSLYQAVKSGSNTWRWEHLKNFPCDVVFINSTNNGSHLEILTAGNKSYLYTYSSNWKEGNKTCTRKTCEPRFYGRDINRYLDLNERDNVGKTNDHVKIKHCKGAGFYPNNAIIAVLTSDTFTHVRIIDNDAYFLFEQNE